MNKYDLITSINTSSAQNSGGIACGCPYGNNHQWSPMMFLNDISQQRHLFFEKPCAASLPQVPWIIMATECNIPWPFFTYLYYFIFMYHIYSWFEHVNMLFSPNILLPWFPHLKGEAGAASGFPRRGVAVLPWPICVCRSWRRTSAQGWAEIFAA